MEERKTLTEAEVATVIQVFSNLFVFGLGLHPEEMEAASDVLDVASGLIKRAAEIKRGYQVTWQSMCYVSRLPSAAKNLAESQEMLSRMLGELGVTVIKQEKISRRCALPGFMSRPKKSDD